MSRYEKDLLQKKYFTRKALAEFQKMVALQKKLSESIKKLVPIPKKTSVEEKKKLFKQRQSLFVKTLKQNRSINKFLDTYIGVDSLDTTTSSRRLTVLYLIRNVFYKEDFSIEEALKKLEVLIYTYTFEAMEMAKDQANIRQILPEEVRQFLPQNIIIDTEKSGVITKIRDRFSNKRDNIEKKMKSLRDIVQNYNMIVSKIKKDFNNPNEDIRLGALLTAIMLETGIRPSEGGATQIKTDSGETIDVETFGALSLLKKHMQFIEDHYVVFQFPGKKNTLNHAEIQKVNPFGTKIFAILRKYAENSVHLTGESLQIDPGEVPLFRKSDGTRFPRQKLITYLQHRVFKQITPKGLRSLRATRLLANALHEEQQEMYKDLEGMVSRGVEDLKDQITKRVIETLSKAVSKAQKGLSHEQWRTTIDHYADPSVILQWLSRGKIENNLEKIVLGDKPTLKFDIQVFLDHLSSNR